MLEIKCPKCGWQEIAIKHNSETDRLRCKCGRCDAVWHEEPLDKRPKPPEPVKCPYAPQPIWVVPYRPGWEWYTPTGPYPVTITYATGVAQNTGRD